MSDFDVGGAYANTLKTFAEVDAAPSVLANTQALTRFHNVQSGLMEDRREADQRLRGILQGANYFDPTQPMSTNLMRLGGAAMQAGDVTAGQALTLHAARTKAAESRDLYSQALATRNTAKNKIDVWNAYGHLLSGVQDQRSLDVANGVMERMTGEPTPEEYRVYDPQRVAVLQQFVEKAADKEREAHDIAMEGLRQTGINNTEEYRRQRLRQIDEAEARRVAAAGKERANGGKDVGDPTPREITAANDLLATHPMVKGLDPAARRQAGFDLAAEARLLRKQGAMDASIALQRALDNKVKRGDFSLDAATGVSGALGRAGVPGFSANRPAYGRKGSSPANPAPLPRDLKDLVPNTYYPTPRKGVALYLGDGKWVAPDPTLANRPAAPQAPLGGGGGIAPLPFQSEEEEDLEDERE